MHDFFVKLIYTCHGIMTDVHVRYVTVAAVHVLEIPGEVNIRPKPGDATQGDAPVRRAG